MPHVDLKHIKVIIGIEIQTEVKNPFVLPSQVVIDLVYRWIDNFLYDPVDQPWADQLVGAITPCAARVGISAKLLDWCRVIRVKSPLVILGEHLERQHVFAVKVSKKGDFRAVFPFFNNHPVS